MSPLRKETVSITNVGELKAYVAGLPDDLPIGRLTSGHYQVNKIGDVSCFVGELPIGQEGSPQTILRISA